jgi:hypothetical protein
MRIPIPGPLASRLQDFAFFAVFLVFAWAGIDTRLIYHWQGPVFYTLPGFLNDFLKYPGGPADYLYALIAQAYASQVIGGIVLTAQVAAVTVLTQAYFTTLAGRALPIVRFIPATLLLYLANLYYDRTPIMLAILLGLAPAVLFIHLSRRWRSEALLLVAFMTTLAAAYYLGGMAVVIFAPAAVIAHIACRRRLPLWIVYLLLSAALPASVELLRLTYMPVSARYWFAPPDLRQVVVYWGLYVFYALGAVIVLLRTSAAPAPGAAAVSRKGVAAARTSSAGTKLPRGKQPVKRQWAAVLATAFLLLGLGCAATVSYRLNSRDRHLAALDYFSFSEDWLVVINASRDLAIEDFNSLTCYEINLALHEMNRLGDDMFLFPQAGSPLLILQEKNTFLPYMIRVTDMCLRLGRVNEAEHYGNEALISGRLDPRIYSLLARINMVKGQTAAARKFLTVLSYDLRYGSWARQRLHELDQDPQLANDPQIQMLRRRMLRTEDMFAVWQSGDKANADMGRLLLDQLEQDPSNRMAFEFLMSAYLRARNLEAIAALMPRIKDMTGPAYVGRDGKRRTPRYYQEAMALYSALTGRTINIEAFEIQPETFQRMVDFKQITEQTPSKEWAKQVTWNGFRDTYFFYTAFGPGDYR